MADNTTMMHTKTSGNFTMLFRKGGAPKWYYIWTLLENGSFREEAIDDDFITACVDSNEAFKRATGEDFWPNPIVIADVRWTDAELEAEAMAWFATLDMATKGTLQTTDKAAIIEFYKECEGIK